MNYLIRISKRILAFRINWKNQEANQEVIRTNFNMDLYLDYLQVINSQNQK
mgnify:CR=1 FL=1